MGGINIPGDKVYDTLTSALKAYNTEKGIYQYRISKGWNTVEAIITPTERAKNVRISIDVPGHGHFDSLSKAYKYFGISDHTYKDRIKRGMTPIEALTYKKEHIVLEGIGEFDSLQKAIIAIGTNMTKYYARINKGLTTEEALIDIYNSGKEKPIYLKEQDLTFKDEKEACKYFNIKLNTYRARIRKGKSVYEALTMNIPNSRELNIEGVGQYKSGMEACNRLGLNYNSFINLTCNRGLEPIEAIKKLINNRDRNILFGVEYKLNIEICSIFNININVFTDRIGKCRWGLHEALVVRVVNKINEVVLNYIGIDNKAYYKVKWSNKPQCARNIVEYYRPDLLDIYDKENPTGEYRPYQTRSDIE